jgi:hypothetical protein
MLLGVAAIALVSVATLVTALIIHSAAIAWICVGASALGLVLLGVDVARDRGQTVRPEHPHTAGDELFGEHDLQRDLVREEIVIDPDMLRSDVPFEEAVGNLTHASQGPRHHHHREKG